MKIMNWEQVKKIAPSGHYNILIFIFLFLQFINAYWEKGGYRINNGYIFSQHLLSYKLGFIPKAFFGSTVGCLTKYLSFDKYCFLIMLSVMFFYICIFIFFIKIRKLSKNNSLVDVLIFFTLALPTSWLYVKDLGRFDIYLLEIFLLCAITCWYRHPLRWLTPILLIIGTLLHEEFLFMYITPILAIQFFKKRDKNNGDLSLLLLSLSAIAIALGLYVYGRLELPSAEKINQYCLMRTSYKLEDNFISMSGYVEAIREGYISFTIKYFTFHLFFQILYSIPFAILGLIVLCLFWKPAYAGIIKGNNTLQRKILFLSPLTNIFLFIGNDYNRWIASFFSVNIVLLFLILSNRENTTSLPFTQKQINFIYIVCAIFFLIAPGNANGFSEFGEKMTSFSCKLIQRL